MNLRLKILLLVAGCWLLVALSACNEAAQQDAAAGSPDLVRRAQVVGHENIQLKRQVRELEAQIVAYEVRVSDLTKQTEKAKQEIITEQQRYANMERTLNSSLQDTQLRLDECYAKADSNSCLEIEAKYAELFGQLTEILSGISQDPKAHEVQIETE